MTEANSTAAASPDFYLPDFCASGASLLIVLIVALLSLILSLSHSQSPSGFWLDLGATAFFLLWIGLGSAGFLCWSRPYLARLPERRASLIALFIPVAVTLAVCEASLRLGQPGGVGTGFLQLFPRERGSFMLRSAGIAFIVTALALRYFYVTHQWRRNVQREARWKIDALQARIRPHFLFNSMNTIASLTRSDPARAEEAVEDLADLFRASLSDNRQQITLKEELEVARIYQRIEQLRLGQRLRVEWLVNELPMRMPVPSLIIQPLLENAIYHGIEPLPEGGMVRIEGRAADGLVELSIRNPKPLEAAAKPRSGNRIALDNVRQRLRLAFGPRADLTIDDSAGHYQVTLRFPAQAAAP
ncbi:MAG: sensor histidine kinase [Proteobacteria bacterium]|nr:sensor histidine kinase [Pseudomonadota bacterium]